jgi:DNA-binding MarR family transcriptional regulator
VRRDPKVGDRRSYGLSLTAAGRQVHGVARKRLRPTQEVLRSALSEQETLTRQTLLRLKQVVDQGRETGQAPPATTGRP